jgi:hypothetical protein
MAINDDATLVIGAGNYFTAPVDTPLPTDLTAPDAVWENVGHTSLEDIFSISSDGGEATVIGTLQNKSLRTSYSTRTETMTFTLQQFDEDSLRLYYGANATIGANGELQVPANPKPTVAAFLVVFIDGDHVFAFYAPKAEIYRADDLSISDTESLAGLPIGVKPLVSGTNAYTYAVTPLGSVGMATGADAGTPGSFTPAGSTVPADLAELQASSIVANPSTAWTTGQYVELGDASQASWNGTGWVAGAAA